MTKVVFVFLAIWLAATVLSIQLAIAENCLGLFKSMKLKKILEKEPKKRTGDEWKKLVEGANKALSNAKCMDIETALEIFQHVNGKYSAVLDRSDADTLIKLRNISEDKCTEEESLMSEELVKLIVHARQLRFGLAELYKAVRVSLNRYTDLCGLEDRYNKIVKRSASTAAAEESTLANQLLGSGEFDKLEKSLLWAIPVIRDPNFGLITEIKCEEDEEFIEKIAEGLIKKQSSILTRYANDVVKNYFQACGYEDRFQLVVEKVAKGYEQHTTLAEYLKQFGMSGKKGKLIPTVKLVLDLTSFDTTDKQNCNGPSVASELVDREKYSDLKVYPVLLKYVQVILGEYHATCGFEDAFLQKIKEFIGREPNSWQLIESWASGRSVAGELVDEACRKFWGQTSDDLVDLVENRGNAFGLFMMSYANARIGYPMLAHWLGNLHLCAYKLGKSDEYVVRKLREIIMSS